MKLFFEYAIYLALFKLGQLIISESTFLNNLMIWGIQVQRSGADILPLISIQTTAIIVAVIVLGRIAIQSVLQKYFMVRGPQPQFTQNSLENSYFYHLSIIILVLNDVNWNLFDLALWVFSYVCIGMLRKAIYTARVQKDQLLDNAAYNCKLVTVLWSSRVFGCALCVFSIIYALWVNFVFIGVPMKMTNFLLFPTFMLAIDSFYLFICSRSNTRDLLCHYNQNISKIPQTHKYKIYHKIISALIRIWHYYSIARLCVKTFIERFQFLDSMWILSVVNASFSATISLFRSVIEYSSFTSLVKKIDKVFSKGKGQPGQQCMICLQQLLNCRKLANCGHLFHYKCLFQWVQTKKQCPICRVSIRING